MAFNYSTPEIVFTIENIGTGNLSLTGSTLIEITDTDASMFAANFSATSTIITPQDSTTFGITFTPTSEGLKTATVSISNNDNDENPYTLTIQGRNVTAEINVKSSFKDIPHITGMFDFFKSRVAKESESYIFTIESIGINDLKLTGTPLVKITGTDASDFAVNTSATLSTIIPGETTTLAIIFKPTSLGVKEATISIEDNDADENPYTFTIKGLVLMTMRWDGSAVARTAGKQVQLQEQQEICAR